MSPTDKELIIAFRGTEANKWKDVATDLRAHKKPITSIHSSSCNDVLKPSGNLNDRNIRVHSGFLKAYLSIKEAILQVVYDITQWRDSWRVLITGHSLGGALATLCAFEIANRKSASPIVSLPSHLHRDICSGTTTMNLQASRW